MKEVTNKKNKNVYYLSDDEYDDLVRLGMAGRFIVKDVEPLRKVQAPKDVVIKKGVKSK